jgi:hypothetical protein
MRSINAKGDAVGCYLRSGDQRAMVYASTTQDLNNLIPAGSEWILLDGFGINDQQITGEGSIGGKNQRSLPSRCRTSLLC